MGEPTESPTTAREQGGVAVESHVDRVHHAVVARGRFEALYQAYEAHARGLGPLPDPAALALMRPALAASTLHLALLPPDQYCTWTLNFLAPPTNVFVAGDNGELQLTGRVYTEEVRVESSSRLFFETQRPRFKPARSVVDFDGGDVYDAYRQFYDRALQMQARILALDDGRVLLVQGLPMVDRDWLASLDQRSAADYLREGVLEPMETRTYRFRCGCDASRIVRVVTELFAGNEEALFGDDDEAEVRCPRCGRRWSVSRSAVAAPKA